MFWALVFLLTFLAFFNAAQPIQVRTSVYVLNLGKFEVSTGSYTIDFYLNFECDSECNPQFEF
ncbi:MAG: hypothetical protein QW343_01805, partial [Candidatus Norongarragalinales archaeon]